MFSSELQQLQSLLLLNPEVSLLIDDFGLMLKSEFDERCQNMQDCMGHVFRRNETIHPDFRVDNPLYVQRNMFEHFWDDYLPCYKQLNLF